MAKKPISRADAHVIPTPPLAVTMAIKGLVAGTATEHQQKLAINWIIQEAAGAYDETYRSDADGGERATAFACGRRAVGLAIVKEINIIPKNLKEA